MKKLLFPIVFLQITFFCYGQNSNGFGPAVGQTIAMGSEVTVGIFKRIDQAWAERDYETLKTYIADEAFLRFDDGTQVTGPKAFVKKIEKQYKEIQKTYGWGWETISAFSVKAIKAEDPTVRNQKGEWINAQFRNKDGSITMEWYQIYEGKVIFWYQAKGMPIIK